MAPRFTGSYCALITPFTNGRVDEDAYRRLIEWHIEQGTHGLVACGTTGESPTLSHAEHRRVIELAVEAAGGRVPVIAGTGSNSTAEAIDLTQHAASSPEQSQPGAPVYAVGVGPGNESFLTQRTQQCVADADVIVGFDTVVDRIADIGDAEILRCSYDDQTAQLTEFSERVAAGQRGVAALWGDPNISGYQFLGRVERAVDRPVRVVPGISSVQIAASRSRIPFEYATFASLHRRGDLSGEFDRLADALGSGRHLLVIVRPYDWMPPDIARALLDRGAEPDTTALVLEELTLPDEAIEETTLGELDDVDQPAQDRYSDRTILTVRARNDD